MSKLVKYSPQQLTAIEIFCKNPSVTQSQIAKACGVERRTVSSWFCNQNFVEAVYERYMEMSGIHLPEVVQSMIEEAKAGNVQAGRLVLEHFGKLENKLKIEVESNFERFMRLDEIEEARQSTCGLIFRELWSDDLQNGFPLPKGCFYKKVNHILQNHKV